MNSVRDLWNDLDVALATGIAIIVILVVAVIAERLFVRFLRRAYWRRVERAAAAREVSELSRVKRQKTLVTLLESLVRYGVYGAALIVILGLVTGGKASAFFGASIVAVLVGFGLQRLLGDVVAGALLLFEGHFAVGDVITSNQYNVTGTVEEFALRTTVLRTLGGDRVTMMNGAMLSFTRWSYGQREFRIDLALRGADALATVEATCGAEHADTSALWIRSPEAIVHDADDDDLIRLHLTCVVAPGHEAIAERLGALLEARLGEDLVGPATVTALYQPTFDEWRAGLLLRG